MHEPLRPEPGVYGREARTETSRETTGRRGLTGETGFPPCWGGRNRLYDSRLVTGLGAAFAAPILF